MLHIHTYTYIHSYIPPLHIHMQVVQAAMQGGNLLTEINLGFSILLKGISIGSGGATPITHDKLLDVK